MHCQIHLLLSSFLLFGYLAASQAGLDSLCPVGWKGFPSGCYLFSTERKSWTDAQTHCRQQGGQLLAIEYSNKQSDIIGELSKRKETMGDMEYWIGLNDRASEGHWVWNDNLPLNETLKNSYYRWLLGEPNNNDKPGHQGADCAAIYQSYKVSKLGMWSDHDCQSRLPFICEKPWDKSGMIITKVCENRSLTLTCPDELQIFVQHAFYGRPAAWGSSLRDESPEECRNNGQLTQGCYISGALEKVRLLCQGKASCTIRASDDNFPIQGPWYEPWVVYCKLGATIPKYLEVGFKCLRTVLD